MSFMSPKRCSGPKSIHCAEILKRYCGVDLREVLFAAGSAEPAKQRINQTAMTQTSLFVIEYALAKLWMSWGVHPKRDDRPQYRRICRGMCIGCFLAG